jgi:hypothetical protein
MHRLSFYPNSSRKRRLSPPTGPILASIGASGPRRSPPFILKQPSADHAGHIGSRSAAIIATGGLNSTCFLDQNIRKSNLMMEVVAPWSQFSQRGSPRPLREFHRHNDMELTLLRSGRLTYQINGRLAPIPQGRLCLLWGGVPHRWAEWSPTIDLQVLCLPMAFLRPQEKTKAPRVARALPRVLPHPSPLRAAFGRLSPGIPALRFQSPLAWKKPGTMRPLWQYSLVLL